MGFACKPFANDKTVVRGGYGMYGNLIHGAIPVQQLPGGPFSGSVTYTNRFVNGTPLFSFPSPFLSAGTTSVQNVNGLNLPWRARAHCTRNENTFDIPRSGLMTCIV